MIARRIWCEKALLPSGLASGVTIAMNDGVITDVRASTEPDSAEVVTGLSMPGMANSHSHAFHRALRSRTHRGSGDFWSWREQMYAVASRLTPENYLALATATFAEMVLAGYTVVGEFHYIHHRSGGQPYDDPNEMGAAIIQAAHDAGIRLTLLDTCYLRGGTNRGLAENQMRFGDESAHHWAARVDALVDDFSVHRDGRALFRIGAAIHSVRAVDAASIAVVARYAANREMPLHAHVSEQPAENEQAIAEYGCSPTELLAQQGALSSLFTAVHATHLSGTDVGLYAMARSTCCLCPTTERDLADGIGMSTELADAGVALAIGSDQHAVIDPFEELRAIEMDERLRSLRRGNHSVASLLAAGSANGYACLGWPGGGAIQVGSLADVISVSFDSVRLAGAPLEAAPDAIVFAASAPDVHNVIVGGRTVVRTGQHTSIDVGSLLQSSIHAVCGDQP